MAVDPAAGKIYWADFTADTIRVGPLTGDLDPNDPGDNAQTLFQEATPSDPSGVAIDPANNKIYWTNQHSHQVRVGPLTGDLNPNDTSDDAQTLFQEPDGSNPIGVAVAAGKLYWTDLVSGLVRTGNLDGSGAQTLFSSETPSGPAIDPTTNKIYWTSWQRGDLGIRVGPLTGDLPSVTGDEAQTLFSGESAALFAAILKAPVNTGRPAISGGAKVGRELTCQNGTWAPDLLGAFLYRAPASFAYQVKLNGSPITPDPVPTSTFIPAAAGDDTCTVTATNQAGSISATSSVKKVKVK